MINENLIASLGVSDAETDALLRAGIRSVRSTHTVPHPTNAIRLDGILAAALRAEIGGEETA